MTLGRAALCHGSDSAVTLGFIAYPLWMEMRTVVLWLSERIEYMCCLCSGLNVRILTPDAVLWFSGFIFALPNAWAR